MDLVAALSADGATLCAVGAGGKKTTLYALAERLPRAAVTATVRIPIFDRQVASVTVTDDPVAAVRAADDWPVGVVAERNGDRYEGYDPEVIDELAAAGVAEAVLVKADGARTRWFKAPGENEPRIPSSADVVVPVVSARVIGQPLSEDAVHRPERVAALSGLALGDLIEPEHVATVLANDDGGLRGVPSGSTAIPLVNMVDDAALEASARAVADSILARSAVPRVVLARMIDTDPVVDVVER